MKFTNLQAFQTMQSLNTLTDIKFPAVASYRILQATQTLQTILSPYLTTRDSIIAKYADASGAVIQKDNPEAYESCIAELKDLDTLEIDIEVKPFKITLLEGIDLTIAQMSALEFLIEE